MPDFFVQFLIIIVGLCVGSYLNVLIIRLPRLIKDEIILEAYEYLSKASNDRMYISPSSDSLRSECYFCSAKLKSYNLIPVFSYLYQSGRSSCCDQELPRQYLIVEIMGALLAWITLHNLPYELNSWLTFGYSMTMLSIFFIDKDHFLIPDQLVFTSLGLALIRSINSPLGYSDHIFGLIVGFLSLLTIQKFYIFTRKIDGLGDGDIKLMASLGCWLGLKQISNILLVSSALALLTMLPLVYLNKMDTKTPFPFGPFLILAWAILALKQNYGI